MADIEHGLSSSSSSRFRRRLLDQERREWWCDFFAFCIVALFLAGTVASAAVYCMWHYSDMDPHYSVAIESATGIEGLFPIPAAAAPPTPSSSNSTANHTDSSTVVVDPGFRLTFGVFSRNLVSRACVERGTYAEVFSRGGEMLAASAPTTRRLCAGPRKARELLRPAVVARGSRARVPRGGEYEYKVFDVRLRVPECGWWCCSESVWVCRGVVAGDGRQRECAYVTTLYGV